MKLIRKANAPILKNKQGLDIPDAAVLTIRTLIDYQKKVLHIKYGLFSSGTALNDSHEPIETGEFLFDETYYMPEYISPDGVTYLYDGDKYYFKDSELGDIADLSQEEIALLSEVYIGQLPFDYVFSTLDLSATETKPITQESKDWIMAQLDWEGKPFNENWEYIEE